MQIKFREFLLPVGPESFCLPLAVSKIIKTYIYIYIPLILPPVLHGCKPPPLTLREEHRLRVFENRVQRKTLGPNRKDATDGYRKLHATELRDFYLLPNMV